jgi:hypothetical protein
MIHVNSRKAKRALEAKRFRTLESLKTTARKKVKYQEDQLKQATIAIQRIECVELRSAAKPATIAIQRIACVELRSAAKPATIAIERKARS